jgi:hypothetical protein
MIDYAKYSIECHSYNGARTGRKGMTARILSEVTE